MIFLRNVKRNGTKLVSVILAMLMLSAVFVTPLSVNAKTSEEETTVSDEATVSTEDVNDENASSEKSSAESEIVESVEEESTVSTEISTEQSESSDSTEPCSPTETPKRQKRDVFSTGSPSGSFYYIIGTGDPTYVSTFEEAWNECNTYYKNVVVGILKDVTLSNGIATAEGREITLELNGHKLDRGLTSADGQTDNGNVITVSEKSTLTVYGGNRSIPKPTNELTVPVWTVSDGQVQNTDYTITNRGVITGGNNTCNGGGIAIKSGGTLNLHYIAVSGNRAYQAYEDDSYGYGGGIALLDSKAQLNMYDSEVSYNLASLGGGICVGDCGNYSSKDTSITMEFEENEQSPVAVFHNTALKNGGGIALKGRDSSVTNNYQNCEITGKCGDGHVGIKDNCVLSYKDGEAVNDISQGYGCGGGIYIEGPYNTINGLDIESNTAKFNGGGLAINENGGCNVNNCDILRNVSSDGYGGGIYSVHFGNVFRNINVKRNDAKLAGDGMYAGADVTLLDVCNIYANDKDGSNQNLYLTNDEHGGVFINDMLDEGSTVCVTYEEGHGPKLTSTKGTYNVGYYDYDNSSHYYFKYIALSRKNIDYYGNIVRVEGQKGKLVPVVQNERTVVDPSKTYQNQPVVKGVYEYLGANGNSEGQYFYSDGYFMESAQNYNTHLATLSVCMANCAMNAKNGGTGSSGEYRDKSNNIRQMMSDIGCADKDIFVNDYFAKRPTDQTIGDCIGTKKLANGDDLIIIAVRGGGYESEWGSNFMVNASGEHNGFSTAATNVFSDLQKFLDYRNIDGTSSTTKFWIAGFSRAGATSNLTAKRIVDAYDNDGVRTFAYPIEPPKGGLESEKKDGCNYDCIHNVLNYCDIVTWVAPGEMDFIRYGVDHFMPGTDVENGYTEGIPADNYTEIVGSESYEAQREKMILQLRALCEDTVYDDYFHKATVKYIDFVSSTIDGEYDWTSFVIPGKIILDTGKIAFHRLNQGLNSNTKLIQEYSSNETVEVWMPKFWKNFVRYAFGSTNPEDVRHEFAGVDYTPSHEVDALSGYADSRDSYSYTFQEGVAYFLNLIYGSDKGDTLIESLKGLKDDLETWTLIQVYLTYLNTSVGDITSPLTHVSYDDLVDTIYDGVCSALIKNGFTQEETDELYGALYAVLGPVLSYVSKDYNNNNQNDLGTMIYNAGRLIQNHDPEVVTAWLRSYDSYYDVEEPMPVTLAEELKAAPHEPILQVKSYETGEITTYTDSYEYFEVDLRDELTLITSGAGYNPECADTGEAIYYRYPNADVDERSIWHVYNYPIKLLEVESDVSADEEMVYTIYAFSSHYDKASNGTENNQDINAFDQGLVAFRLRAKDNYSLMLTPKRYDADNGCYVYSKNVIFNDDTTTAININGIKPGVENLADRWKFDHWIVYPYNAETKLADTANPVQISDYESLFGEGFDYTAENTSVHQLTNNDYMFEPSYNKLPVTTFKVPKKSQYADFNDYTFVNMQVAYDTDNPISFNLNGVRPRVTKDDRYIYKYTFDQWYVYSYSFDDTSQPLDNNSSGKIGDRLNVDDYSEFFGESFNIYVENTIVTNLNNQSYLFYPHYNVKKYDSQNYPKCTASVPTSGSGEVWASFGEYHFYGEYEQIEVDYNGYGTITTSSPTNLPSPLDDYEYEFLGWEVKCSQGVVITEENMADYLGGCFSPHKATTEFQNVQGIYDFTFTPRFARKDESIVYSINGNGSEVSVVRFQVATSYVEIPKQVEIDESTYYVTGISENAFAGNYALEYVDLPSTIRKIGNGAFKDCKYLKAISNSGQATRIGAHAFSGCTNLRGVTLNQNLDGPKLGNGMFGGCSSLRSITIPDTINTIGEGAFSDCVSLTIVMFMGMVPSVHTFENGAFSGCSKLKSIDASSVSYFGEGALSDCSSLEKIEVGSASYVGAGVFSGCKALTKLIVNDVAVWATEVDFGGYLKSSGDAKHDFYVRSMDDNGNIILIKVTRLLVSNKDIKPYSCSYSGLTDVTIRGGDIGEGAFLNCLNLNTPTLSGVVSIGNQAFHNCKLNDTLEFPASLKSIGEYAFGRLIVGSSSGRLSIVMNDNIEYVDADAFEGRNVTSLTINGSTVLDDECSLRDTVYRLTVKGTHIADDAFKDFTNLGKVSFSDNVTDIGDASFKGCYSLREITIPDSVTSIGDDAFTDCAALYDLKLGNSITTIGENAFACTDIRSVTIPDSVTSIGSYAFSACPSLLRVTIGPDSNLSTLSQGTFSASKKVFHLSVPGNGSFEYDNLPKSTVSELTVTGDSVNQGAFAEWPQLEELTIENNVNEVEENAFEFCKNLMSVSIGNGVSSLAQTAFSGCKKIETLSVNGNSGFNYEYLPKSAVKKLTVRGTAIKESAFTGFPKLMKVSISDNVSSIGASAFKDCPNIEKIVIPDAVTAISDETFMGCTNLEKITLGDGITEVGAKAFKNCESLSDIRLPDKVENIGNEAFMNCTSLPYMAVPDAVTAVGDKAFYYCESLETLLLPEGLNTIGEQSFYQCKDLRSLDLPSTVTAIGDSAFNKCSKLKELAIPKGVESVGISTFANCTNLETAFVWGRTTTVGNGVFANDPKLTIYAYDSSPTDTYALNASIPFFPIVNTNTGNGYKDDPITDTQTVDEEDTGFGLYIDVFNNLELLGVQLKTDEGTNDMRFVAVLNEGIVSEATRSHDIEDYGFVLAKTSKNSTYSTGEENLQKIQLGAPNTISFSCKKTSNKISGDYGIYSNSNTKYKYITLGVKNVDSNPDQGLAVRFYVKTHSGRVYYAKYNVDYTGCAASYSLLFEGENSTVFSSEWKEMALKEEE